MRKLGTVILLMTLGFVFTNEADASVSEAHHIFDAELICNAEYVSTKNGKMVFTVEDVIYGKHFGLSKGNTIRVAIPVESGCNAVQGAGKFRLYLVNVDHSWNFIRQCERTAVRLEEKGGKLYSSVQLWDTTIERTKSEMDFLIADFRGKTSRIDYAFRSDEKAISSNPITEYAIRFSRGEIRRNIKPMPMPVVEPRPAQVDQFSSPCLDLSNKLYTIDSVYIVRFLSDEIIYPELAKEMGLEGVVYISMTVFNDGSCRVEKLVRGAHEILNKEALRVANKIQGFAVSPGHQTCSLILPFRFQLN